MKKLYFILLFTALTIVGFSQTILTTSYPDTIEGKYTESIIEQKLIVSNVSANSMSMHVYRTTLTMPQNSVNYYCWGPNCFPPTTSLSTDPVFFNSGDSDSSFVSYLEPQQEEGITAIEYCFFDELGSGDSLCINMVFKAVPPPIGITETENQNKLFSIVPNPAKDFAFLRYHVQSQGKATLQVFDLVGKKQTEINLASGENNLLFPVSELNNGIYLCNLVIDNKIIDTQKLIVNH